MTFSPRAIEAAARASYEHEPIEKIDLTEIPWGDLSEGVRDRFRHKAKATITAALAVDGMALQGWQKITEENEPPRDIPLLLAWWREWPERKCEIESGLYGSAKGGWTHGQATHWMPLPQPPPAASDGEERPSPPQQEKP